MKLIFVFALLLFNACQVEDNFDGGSVPAFFTPGFAGDLVADIDTDERPGTRATNNTWTSGDRVGIYMLNGSNYTLTSALKKNVEYQATSTTTSATLSPVATANTIYYPVNGNTVRFVAYSPYSSTATSANQVTYNFTTQSSKANKESKDFIFYRGTTDRSKTNATENMTFKHKFSKINITVKQGTGGPSCSGLTMTLTKMPISATVNLATLASSATNENSVSGLGISTSATTISPYVRISSIASASVEAIVAPHTGSGNFTGRTFTFSADGVNYSYSLADNVNFDAEKVYNFEFTLTQTAAVLTSTRITDWTGGNVSWNKEYALTTSANSLNYGYKTSTQTVTIRTKGSTKKPITSRSTSATTITGSPTWITTYSLGTGTTSGEWTIYTLTVTVYDNISTYDRTPAYVHVDMEGVKVVITVNQSGTNAPAASVDNMSNCYIVAPGGTVTFPVTRAYTGGVLKSNYTGEFQVQVLWDDNSVIRTATVSGSGTAAKITVNANSNQGNALVALRVRGKEIVWSYHIWVVNIDLNNTWDAKNNGGRTLNPYTKFMDRNLGATTNALSVEGRGLFYQWGRKDPFPKTDITGFYYATNTGPISLEQSIRTPNVFTTINSNPYDWLDDPNNYLWVTPDNYKTIYDPCPIGWRLPPSSYDYIMFPWYGLEISRFDPEREGGNRMGTSNWPASGSRNMTTGIAQGQGFGGNYLTSDGSFYNNCNCWRLYPANYGEIITETSERAVGSSVRCVADSY